MRPHSYGLWAALERLGSKTLFSYRSGGILTVEALESILFLALSL
jgi:hypothetical protein